MKPRVFVVQPIMVEALDRLRQHADVEVFGADRMISRAELKAGLAEAQFLYTLGDVPIDVGILDASPGLRGIAAMTMITNVIDLDAATERGILVTNIDHVIQATTADLTMAILLGLATRLVEADHFTRSGRFRQEQSVSLLWHSLPGKVLGLIGLGAIGQKIAARARAFEMEVRYTKRSRLAEDEERALGVAWVAERDELIRQADFLCLMAKYGPETHRMIGAREFALMKRTAFFINTARGRLVDEGAMLGALREGRIAGAGLDVYWTEPPVGEPSPPEELFKMDNVILTPHIGSATWEARRQMSLLAAENLIAMIRGERPRNLLNPGALGERRGGGAG